ncbi:MAG: hypothetical protein ACRD3O_09240 [Terriglobia bacterium]
MAGSANQGKPKGIDNDLGATLGGPIMKNKVFFFASYEGDFLRETSGEYATAPTRAMENRNFSATGAPIYNPFTGSPDGAGKSQFLDDIIPGNLIGPIAQKLNGWPRKQTRVSSE